MRFFVLYTAIAVTLIHADDTITATTTTQYQAPFFGQVTQAEDVGAVHTKAFEALARLHETNGRPTNRKGLLKNTISIMTAGFCESPPDQACIDRVTQITKKEFAIADEADEPSLHRSLKEDHRSRLSPALMESMERLETIVNALDDQEVTDVVSELEALRQEVLKLDFEAKEEEAQRSAVLAALSVASESATLWDKVYSDPDHALYGLHLPSYYKNDKNHDNAVEEPATRTRRRLQYAGGYGGGYGGGLSSLAAGLVASVILADVMGGFRAAIALIMEDFSILTTNPSAVFLAAVQPAISASVASLFGGGYDDGYDDYDDTYEYDDY